MFVIAEDITLINTWFDFGTGFFTSIIFKVSKEPDFIFTIPFTIIPTLCKIYRIFFLMILCFSQSIVNKLAPQ